MKALHLYRSLVVLPLAALLAGCPGRGDDRVDETVRIDTTNENPLDGLSAEQLEREAAPMTLEEARELGIVDTTIHLEDHATLEDTLPVPRTAPPAPADTPAPPPGP
jgi:hypothetical protein